MTLHDQRGLFVVGRAEVRILWRVEETVSDQSAFGRKVDRARHREVRRKSLAIIGATKNLKLPACDIKLDDRDDVRGRAAAKHRETVRRAQVLNIRVRTVNGRHLSSRGIYDRQR